MKLFFLIVVVIAISSMYFRWGYDDTDDPRSGELFGRRSGLTVYTDHRTGVQYVKAGLFGGIHPRVDKDGKPITVK